MNYIVYKIEIDNITRYVGYSKNIDNRERQHNSDCYNMNSKAYLKPFYKFVRSMYPENLNLFKLIPIYICKNKVEAKHFECLQILLDRFGDRQLLNKVPSISDR